MLEYGENKGDIWVLSFYTKERVEIPEKEQQDFIDKQTRELGGTFNPPPGLSPSDYSSLFLNHFMKSRTESRDLLEKGSELKIRHTTRFQVGNMECLQDMQNIEQSPNFHSWENPSLVEYFKIISNTQ